MNNTEIRDLVKEELRTILQESLTAERVAQSLFDKLKNGDLTKGTAKMTFKKVGNTIEFKGINFKTTGASGKIVVSDPNKVELLFNEMKIPKKSYNIFWSGEDAMSKDAISTRLVNSIRRDDYYKFF